MTRIFRYILSTDNGMAPCIDDGRVSLATCKPQIRRSAKPGDWVMGFFPSPAPPGVLAWAGRVADCYDVGAYERAFRGRSDAVYRQNVDGTMRALTDYHPEESERRKDLSAPVLLFDPTASWYFGDQPEVLPEELMHVAAKGRPYRVNGTNPFDPDRLLAWLRGTGTIGVRGRPRHAAIETVKRCGC